MAKKKDENETILHEINYMLGDMEDPGDQLRDSEVRILLRLVSRANGLKMMEDKVGCAIMSLGEIPMGSDAKDIVKKAYGYEDFMKVYSPGQMDQICDRIIDRCKKNDLTIGMDLLLDRERFLLLDKRMSIRLWRL